MGQQQSFSTQTNLNHNLRTSNFQEVKLQNITHKAQNRYLSDSKKSISSCVTQYLYEKDQFFDVNKHKKNSGFSMNSKTSVKASLKKTNQEKVVTKTQQIINLNIKQNRSQIIRRHSISNNSQISNCKISQNIKKSQQFLINLCKFQDSLTVSESIYILKSLIQSYYEIYNFYHKLIINVNDCFMNELGQVIVYYDVEEDATKTPKIVLFCYNFVSILHKIFEIVTFLINKQNQSGFIELNKVYKIIIDIVYSCNNQQKIREIQIQNRIYRKILQKINEIIQNNNFKSNLLKKVIEYSLKTNKLTQKKSRFNKTTNDKMNQYENVSDLITNDKSDFFKKSMIMDSCEYCQKVQGNRYSLNEEVNYINKDDFYDKDDFDKNAKKYKNDDKNDKMNKKSNNRNSISYQFSLNILNEINLNNTKNNHKEILSKNKKKYNKNNDISLPQRKNILFVIDHTNKKQSNNPPKPTHDKNTVQIQQQKTKSRCKQIQSIRNILYDDAEDDSSFASNISIRKQIKNYPKSKLELMARSIEIIKPLKENTFNSLDTDHL